MAHIRTVIRTARLVLTLFPWTAGVLLERAGWRILGTGLVQASDRRAARLGEGV